MTLNDVMASILRCFTEFGRFGKILSQWLKLDPPRLGFGTKFPKAES